MNKKNNKISGWAGFPKIYANSINFQNINELSQKIKSDQKLIARGNGRSYGDSSLADYYISSLTRDRFLNFDNSNGLLRCEAGVLLYEILDIFVPKGWFLNVAPGTKMITIGGAVASDIHGKNHHKYGCFSESINQIKILLANGQIEYCSKSLNRELFLATCGGMGLTGIILEVSFYLKKIKSSKIDMMTIKTQNLKETFNEFEKNHNKEYSVAWIDCYAKGKSLGRSIISSGGFSSEGGLNYKPKRKIQIPSFFPSFLLNFFTVKLFNSIYYIKAKNSKTIKKVNLDNFFFPLDSIKSWNRIYGKKGFIQYQFILPKKNSYEGLKEILSIISYQKKHSFLAVLKLYGHENDNYLSFPLEGYSLALDFKMQPGIFEFLKELDKVVLSYNGRIYLSKDSRVSKEVFERGYPKIEKFRKLRKEMNLRNKFSSLQSERLEL